MGDIWSDDCFLGGLDFDKAKYVSIAKLIGLVKLYNFVKDEKNALQIKRTHHDFSTGIEHFSYTF